MTGYQEVLTDPSYMGQLVTFTYPELGNTGVNDEDNENNVTTYSDLISDSSWSTTSTNVITLNDQALEDIRNNDFFQCALINYDYDLKDLN